MAATTPSTLKRLAGLPRPTNCRLGRLQVPVVRLTAHHATSSTISRGALAANTARANPVGVALRLADHLAAVAWSAAARLAFLFLHASPCPVNRKLGHDQGIESPVDGSVRPVNFRVSFLGCAVCAVIGKATLVVRDL